MHAPPAKVAPVQALAAQGQFTQARAACQRLAQQFPADPAVAGLFSHILLNLAELPQAIYFAQRLCALTPSDPEAHKSLAGLLLHERRTPEALAALAAAAALAPDDPTIPQLAATGLAQADQFIQALARVEAALLASAPSRELLSLRATCLLNLGDPAGAVASLRSAAALAPDDPAIASELALTLNYLPGASTDEVLAAHRAYAALLDRTQPAAPPNAPRPAHPPRRPRVGILSPDLRTHSVAFFLLPWLRHRQRDAFDLYAYFTNRHADAMTATIRGCCTAWRDMGNTADHTLAAAIAADQIDLLLDLSGHTAGHSLAALHGRPAPAQVTYLGYPNTTGLTQISTRIVDSITDPPGDSDRLCTERLSRLDPCFLCFEPPAAAPPVSPPPCLSTGAITFASFNAAAKINNEVLALWSRLLSRLPASRLLLKAPQYADPQARAHLADRFRAVGGDPARLTVLPPTKGQADHLACYAQADIALDPFPYHGTTTTLEALWMGLPVVTRIGATHASRVGLSILSAISHADLACSSDEAYLDLAASLAADTPRLTRLRSTLRAAVQASPLCDAPAFSKRFDACLRACLPADTIAP